MGNRKRLRGYGNSSGDRFVKLPFWLLNSEAWKRLSLPGRCLLVELLKRYNGFNNGDISFSHREAARILKVGKNTATKLFWQLERLGFIKTRQRGSFDWKIRHATTWKLTMHPCDGCDATKDFMRIGAAEVQDPIAGAGTVGPRAQDRGEQTARENVRDDPRGGDRQTRVDQPVGPSGSDASSIPGGAPHQLLPVRAQNTSGAAVRSMLKSARRSRGWSQADLARKVNASRSHIANIEAGRGGGAELLRRIAQKLGVETGRHGDGSGPP